MRTRTDGCTGYRVYTAALADGEHAQAPWRARLHIRRCGACRAELATQIAVSRRIGEVLHLPEPAASPRPRQRRLEWAVAAALFAAAAATVAGLILTTRADPVPAALAAATRPPTIHSADAPVIERWCVHSGVAAPPVLTLSSLRLDGARMDSAGPAMMITVYYVDPAGGRMTVTWVGSATRRGEARSETVALSRTVLAVSEDSADVALITGTVQPADLWRAAAAIAASL